VSVWLAAAVGLFAYADQAAVARLNEEGLRLLNASRIREAEQHFRAAVREDPNNVEALNNLGVTLKRERKFTAAVEVLRRAVHIAPKDARIRSNLASALRGRSDLSGAASEMARAAALAPTNSAIVRAAASYSRDYGIDLYRRGQFQESVSELRKSAAVLVKDPAVHYNLGRALTKLGRKEEAASELSIAEELDRRSRESIRAKSLNNEGTQLLQAGDLQRGLERLEKAVALAPDDPVSRYNYGVALLVANRLDESIEELRKSITLNPDQANAHYYLGRARMLKREWPSAIDELENAVRLNPSDRSARTALLEAKKHAER
jgi:Flp pilus assembly protein TadD